MLDFNFSIYNLLSIVTSFVGFLYAFQIGTLKKIKSTDTKYFTWFLTILSLIVLFFFLVDLNIRFKSITIIILLLVVPLSLLLGPLMWLYIRKLISFERGKKPIIHFLPAIIVGVLVISLSSFAVALPKESIALKKIIIDILSIISLGSLAIVFVFQNIYYIVLSIKGYRIHRRKMEQIYSYSEEVDLSWVRVMIFGYVFFIVGMVAVNTIKGEDSFKVKQVSSYKEGIKVETLKHNGLRTNDKVALEGYVKDEEDVNHKVVQLSENTFYLSDIPYNENVKASDLVIKSANKKIGAVTNVLFDLIILLYIIYTGHHAIKQKSILVRETESNDRVTAEEDKVISETQLLVFQKIKEELLEVMKTEKPYLDHNLNIFTLSKRLNTNSKYLSQVINQEFNKSFVHFVNEYRIEEVKQILLLNNNYTIEAQSQMVGFKSKSSFNIAFKRHTGLTPSLFIQGHR